jgi:hypothetical protein
MQRLQTWKRDQQRWNVTLYCLSGIPISLTLVAGFYRDIWTTHLWISGLLALVSAVLVTFLAISTPAKQVRQNMRAWRHLDDSLAKYRVGLISTTQLIEAVKDGETILGERDP